MGGDGGTKAVNRAYLRGAGAASTTGDHPQPSSRHHHNSGDKHMEAQEARRAMQYCYITDQPLQFNDNDTNNDSNASSKIVTCRYGRLYNKEAAIEALLQRRQKSKSTPTAVTASISEAKTSADNGTLQNRLGLHVRGLKDLYPVRFQTIPDEAAGAATSAGIVIPVCPIMGRELNGRITAYALVPGHTDTTVNVVSEYALKQLSEQEVLTEYGATKKIRLLAPPSLYETIDQEYMKEAEVTRRRSTGTGTGSNKKRKLKHDKTHDRDGTAEDEK